MPAWLIALGTPIAKWAISKGKDFALKFYQDVIMDLGQKSEVELTEEMEALRKTILAYQDKDDVPKSLLDQYWVLNEKLTSFK